MPLVTLVNCHWQLSITKFFLQTRSSTVPVSRLFQSVNFLCGEQVALRGQKRFPIVFMLGKVIQFPLFSGVQVLQNICSLVILSTTGTSSQQYRCFETLVIKLTRRRSGLLLCTTPIKNLSHTLLKATITNWSWKVQNEFANQEKRNEVSIKNRQQLLQPRLAGENGKMHQSINVCNSAVSVTRFFCCTVFLDKMEKFNESSTCWQLLQH